MDKETRNKIDKVERRIEYLENNINKTSKKFNCLLDEYILLNKLIAEINKH